MKLKKNYNKEMLASMKKGEIHMLNGTLLTVRDNTLKKIKEMKNPPVSFENKLLFFCGPTPTPKEKTIGSIGPTTTDRMTEYFEMLLGFGSLGFLGKGDVDKKYDSLLKNRAVLLSITGGIGALLSKCVVSSRVVAFPELGAEAIYEMKVENFPVLVSKEF